MEPIFQQLKRNQCLLMEEIQSELNGNIYNYIIEHTNPFNYLDCCISYQNEKDITVKVLEFLKITGIISRTLNHLKSKNTLD